MTLCIAAACQDRGKPRIIIGTDWKAGTGEATSEVQDKLCWASDCVPVLIAGNVSRAKQFADTLKEYLIHLSKQTPPVVIEEYKAVDHIHKVVALFKGKLAEEYVSMKLGIGYKAFREAVGRSEIPSSIATQTFNEIARIDLECSVIVCIFQGKKSANIFRVDTEGAVHTCDHFAAIGTGSTIAEGKTTGEDSAIITRKTMASFAMRWDDLSLRLSLVPGKEVLRSLRERIQATLSVSLTDAKIVDAIRKDEIAPELVLLVQNLEAFRAAPVQ